MFHPFIKEKQKLMMLISSLSEVFRDAVAFKSGSDKFISVDKNSAVSLGSNLTRAQLMMLPGVCRKYADLLSKNANQALLITAFCSELRKTVGK